MGKRYYWLKLPEDWFRQKSIKKLRRIAGGDTYTIIYLKMLLIAMKQDGKLYYEGVEDNFHEELAMEIDEDPENVRITLAFLLSQHLIEPSPNDEYLLPESIKMTGSESSSAERVRKFRDKQKALQCNTDVTQVKRLCNVEKEKEKEIEIDKTFCPEQASGPPQTATGNRPGAEENGVNHSSAEKEDGMQPETLPFREDVVKPEVVPSGNDGVSLKTASSPEVFIYLPLKTGDMYAVTMDYVAEMKALYPLVNVEQELRGMKGWCENNPQRRKEKRGIRRFMNGWLKREQARMEEKSQSGNQALSADQNSPGWNPPKNRFHNFECRDYDYADLEKRLLQADLPEGRRLNAE